MLSCMLEPGKVCTNQLNTEVEPFRNIMSMLQWNQNVIYLFLFIYSFSIDSFFQQVVELHYVVLLWYFFKFS